MTEAPLHRPVLVDEVLTHLAAGPGARVLDCTLGLGGHAEALLARGVRLVGVDRDPQARALARERLAAFSDRLDIVGGSYATVAEGFAKAGERFDAVLADLGVSSMQLDDDARGFGLHSDAPLDLRMGPDGEDARALIDRLDENELADVIFQYGEERLSRRIARAIKRDRAAGRLETARDLGESVRRTVAGHQQRHPAMRTFQALRIAVNDELGQLDRLLAALPTLLAPGGRAAVISFHSLEDRRVKESFRAGKTAGAYVAIAKKVVTASEAELAVNRRASSAKLRWAVAADATPHTA
ncbi:MAG TPA: 16S rRNA (cytosine(1402)-N(4))-methyltransferase RsmH [Planctomycetota bacterium]|nr:16S rRNA (cytosine(1402)-N(4))-methyltransferase RsmH [Planctomycetota bacterium]